MMQRPAPHSSNDASFGELREKAAGPLDFSAVRAGSDVRKLESEAGHPLSEAPILAGILFRREIAAATPRLVADSPIAHVQRVAHSACGSSIRQRRAARR